MWVLSSCGPTVIYHHEEKVPASWTYQDSLVFGFEVSDTSLAYDMWLYCDHQSTFPFENLYLQITTTFPDGSKTVSPLSLRLSDEKGDWQGKCSGQKCNIEIPISSRAYYKLPGLYHIVMHQYSRQDSLHGIDAISIKISQSPPQ